MLCQTCVYYREAPGATTCRGCGRYLSNKQGQFAIACALTIGLAIFSHYLLTSYFLTGPRMVRLVWLESGFLAPYSIYESPAYMAACALTLAALVVAPAVMTLHFGLVAGLLVGLAAGMASGVFFGPLMIPMAAGIAAIRAWKRAPRMVWLAASAAAGTIGYLILAWRFGPADPLYRSALYEFLLVAGLLSLALAAAAGIAAAVCKYNSLAAVAVIAVMAAAPVAVFFSGVGVGRLEAGFVRYVHGGDHGMSGDLPEGFASGQAVIKDRGLGPKKQLGNVFDTCSYVDVERTRAIVACDQYLTRFPASADAAGIALLKARMLNTRVDVATLQRYNRLETYSDRVGPETIAVYQGVVGHFPGTPEAALAQYYAAEATFQAGKVMEAQAQFAAAERALSALVPPSYYPDARPAPATAGDLYRSGDTRRIQLEEEMYRARLEARRMQSFIAHNSDFGGQPLARFAALDPRSGSFGTEATTIITTYKTSKLVDNIKLALAERLTDPVERRAALEALLEDSSASDAQDEMLYTTARAELAADMAGDASRAAELKLRRLIADYPSSTYFADATALLAKVTAKAAK
jgi:TolA-binding protein